MKPCRNGHFSERNKFGACKECCREAHQRWLRAHPEKRKERAAYARKWDDENRDRVRLNEKNRRSLKRDIVNQAQREWRANNPEKWRIYLKTYRDKNPELIKILNKKWAKANPDKIRKMGRVRQAARRACMPKWVDRAAIKAIYDGCPSGYHVDHIVPVKGKYVCGLHVPWNLQYLPPLENIRKGNRLIESCLQSAQA